MVSWAADGTLPGYDPISNGWNASLYKLASNGSYDTNGPTRIQYQLDGKDHFLATAQITFVSGDTLPTAKSWYATMFVTPASYFDPGFIPTANQIINATKAKAYRSSSGYRDPGTYTFVIAGPSGYSDLSPNTKYWVLVVPTYATPGSTPSAANDIPVDLNAGRAISLWTNQTPAAPTITSPASGTIAAPGSTINFLYTPNDPDALSPDDPSRYNRDLAGVQLQYAPVPTADNPNPEWSDLNFYDRYLNPRGSWYIMDTDPQSQLTGTYEMVTNLGFPIKCDDVPDGADAVLPHGDWQLRCRTFDYGHPDPRTTPPVTAPWVQDSNGNTYVDLTPDSYPAANTSPWSEVVTVSIPGPLPPPVPISPLNGIAIVEDTPVTLAWQYRSTHTPPFTQTSRTVQMRKIGDPDWSTVAYDFSADASIVIPTETQADPAADPLSALTDGTFESGSVDGWTGVPAGIGIQYTTGEVVSVSTNGAFDGTHFLSINYTSPSDPNSFIADIPGLYREFVPDDSHHIVNVSGHVKVGPQLLGWFMKYGWLDSSGAIAAPIVTTNVQNGSPFQAVWEPIEFSSLRPANGAKFFFIVYAVASYGNTGTAKTVDSSSFGLDDMSIVSSGTSIDAFTIDATHEYQWRVKVTDSDGNISDWSSPAAFWVVPTPASGSVLPVPSDTIDGATLGCGVHRVFVYRRGGTERVGEIRGMSHIDWSRVRDDISTAQVIVSDWDLDCGTLLARLQTWAYELVIYRDNGYSVDRVWEGPITLLTYEVDKVTIDAKDVMGYAYRRIIKQAMNDTANGDTVTNRALRILQNAFAPDDPNVLAYLQMLARDDDAMEYRSTPAYSRTAYEEVDDMAANAGLDYTVVGRAILLWGTKHRIGSLPEFRDENFGSPPIVSEYGMSMANRYAVGDGTGVYGEATVLDENGQDPIYGLVEMLSSSWASDSESDTGTYTQAGLIKVQQSFADSAQASIADRYPPPVVVRVPDNTTLNPDAVVSIQHLVPGVAIPLRSTGTLRTVVATQKLDSIKVVEEKGVETISVTMSPFSRDDADPDEDEDE